MTYYERIKELVEYHQYADYISVRCPFPDHTDESPSCFVYEDVDKPENNRKFHCSGCGKTGTHQYLLKVITGHNVSVVPNARKTQKFLPRWARWEQEYGSIENLVHHAHNNLNLPYYQTFFKKRKIESMIEQLKLGMIGAWAIFPIFDSAGKVVDVVVRNTQRYGDSRYVIHPSDNETPLLYVPNWKRVNASKHVYIVYGIIDAISLEMGELPVITGLTGKSLSYTRLINLGKKYSIIPDKGEELAARNLAASLGNFTKVIRLPFEDSEKDTDNIRTLRGVETLKSLIQGA